MTGHLISGSGERESTQHNRILSLRLGLNKWLHRKSLGWWMTAAACVVGLTRADLTGRPTYASDIPPRQSWYSMLNIHGHVQS